jgi:Xaa-Pro aminopeptidase
MNLHDIAKSAREYMDSHEISGWLLYDYRGMNPIFWETAGHVPNVTRPCWLWVPAKGDPALLVSYVDQGRFVHLGVATTVFVGRREMTRRLAEMLGGARRVAMEYSPLGELPRVSRVDSGTLELVRSLGVEVVSSGDTLQHATQRWSEAQLRSHFAAAGKLDAIVLSAFRHIRDTLDTRPTEHGVAEFIRDRYDQEGMEAGDGPVVAVNDHSSDPHFDPTPQSARVIREGDWVLIDLWARMRAEGAVYADITWVGHVGGGGSEPQRRVFEAVTGARDAALGAMKAAFDAGRSLQGWELDKVARDLISEAGFGNYFKHRLGHSLGREVHSNAVNLDDLETHDTRRLVPGIAVTIEPGIYLPEFGVRSEIDVYMSEEGPQVTTRVQREVVTI